MVLPERPWCEAWGSALIPRDLTLEKSPKLSARPALDELSPTCLDECLWHLTTRGPFVTLLVGSKGRVPFLLLIPVVRRRERNAGVIHVCPMGMPAISPTQFAIIIGAMKCGTSALFKYLSRNPQIAPSREEEPGFFAFDRLYNKGIDSYYRQWDFDPSQHRVALEASTHYSKAPQISGVPERVHQQLKNIKFIYLVSNPFDRIESQYNFDLYRGRISSDTPITSEHFLDVSKYRYQLAQFEKFFSRDTILVLPSSMLQSHLRESLTNVCNFLEIDDDFSPLSPVELNVTYRLTETEVLLRRLGLGFALRRLPLGHKSTLFAGKNAPTQKTHSSRTGSGLRGSQGRYQIPSTELRH